MTEPDEATLWARENAAKQCDRDREPRIAAAYRQGQYDDDHLKADAEAYRAGQAASAERIKALEEALRPLAECEIIEPDVPIPDDHGARYFMTYGEIRRARARLKEADQ
jgi:hypothetical protein